MLLWFHDRRIVDHAGNRRLDDLAVRAISTVAQIAKRAATVRPIHFRVGDRDLTLSTRARGQDALVRLTEKAICRLRDLLGEDHRLLERVHSLIEHERFTHEGLVFRFG